MQTLEFYRDEFVAFLEHSQKPQEPKNLYDPIDYILFLGGKRLRPVLTLIAAELFGCSYKKALPAAMAIEVFHNFSLVHDDIMDDAPLRRGKETVHEKWDVNTGILSGDAMLIHSYEMLLAYKGDELKLLFSLFNKTAKEVCEGQQYDVDFESRTDVTISEYLRMIEFKTSVLLAAALKMGAIIAQASAENQDLLYEFGKHLGIAFQLQDDYLDAFGDPDTFGKQVGGDIIENKKTFLYIKALELASSEDRKALSDLFSHSKHSPHTKVAIVKDLYRKSGAVEAIQKEIENYTTKAFRYLSEISASVEGKDMLYAFGKNLMQRTS